MSIFGKFNRGRREAKEQLKNKAAEKEGDEVVTVVKEPYKHIPTHAAFDALNGAPGTWKIDDRSKIKEQHKRRSQMIISRNTSQQQIQGSYMVRNSSYSTYGASSPMAWGDTGYYPNEGPVQKRYKLGRGQSTGSMSGSLSGGHQYNDSGIGPSRLASNTQSEEVSPVVSSGNSTSSNSSEPMEMPGRRPKGTIFQEQNVFDRLHTSTTRKLGEAPQHTGPPVEAKTPTAVVTEMKPQNKRSRWSMLGKKAPTQIAT